MPLQQLRRVERRWSKRFDVALLEHSAYLDTPWITRLVDFAQKVLAQDRVKIIGICFGHQIVGRAMGVKVGKSDRGWEVSVMDMELTEKGKELFGKEKLVCLRYCGPCSFLDRKLFLSSLEPLIT